jgi:hypothetical protein
MDSPAWGHATVEFGSSGVIAQGLFDFLMIFTKTIEQTPITMGKYRIAACPRQLPGGRYAAQVSIASGRGSACTDRVMRFRDEFASHDDAVRYAIAQGIDWVRTTTRPH